MKKTARSDTSASPSPATGVKLHLEIRRRTLLVVCLLLVLPLIVIGWFGFFFGEKFAAARAGMFPSRSLPAVGTGETSVRPGPWGDLHYIRTYVEIPDECLSTHLDEMQTVRWFFKGFSREQLSGLLEEAGLPADTRRQLLLPPVCQAATNGFSLQPTADIILSLPPTARAKIYSTLARFPENGDQANACQITSSPSSDFFADSGLAAATIALMRQLSYPYGKYVLFADMPVVLRQIQDDGEKRRLVKFLTREPTLLLDLRITPQTDINGLVKYWGRAGYGLSLQPLLEGVVRLPQGATLGIVNILPPMPSARLYTFPYQSRGVQADCLWTAFNFFKDTPDPFDTDPATWSKRLTEDYYPVSSDPRYGDLVLFIQPSGGLVHACVYLADDIVFTKNGGYYTDPWVITTVPDLLNLYGTTVGPDEQLKTVYYRNKYY